jgi:hypothetical protein
MRHAAWVVGCAVCSLSPGLTVDVMRARCVMRPVPASIRRELIFSLTDRPLRADN